MELLLVDPGSRVYVRRDSIIIGLKSGKRIQVTSDVDQIIVASSRVSITSKAIRLASRLGIDIVFLDSRGDVVARVYPPIINKTVMARIGQYSSVNTSLAKAMIREIVYSKIHNQAQVLKYVGKSRREDRIIEGGWEVEHTAQEILEIPIDKVNPEDIRSIEAKAARRYWSIVSELLPESLGFKGRDPEGIDVFNIALNYGYGILYAECEKALILAGLDPYLGLLHTLKSGRPSLTLDFIEMFRAPIVDKALIVNAHRLQQVKLINNILEYESRKLVASIVLDSLHSTTRSSKRRRALRFKDHVRLEAQDLADAFRSGEPYLGFRVIF
ncbi:MAG: CRISPR-associated endonuclease Cas1 [Acidilobaceae archaeon]